MKCPECQNQDIISEGDGIMSCKVCNLIFDSGPQWMKYKPSEGKKKTFLDTMTAAISI